MKHFVLTIGISQTFYRALEHELADVGAVLVRALDISDGVNLFSKRDFSLVVTDLRALERHSRIELLAGMRRMRFVPIFALADYHDEDLIARILDFGVDVCQPRDLAPQLLAKQAKAIFRRYTAYNHYDKLEAPEAAPFQAGDLYIDPLRRVVQVLDRPLTLRPREFSLLLYLMRNPGIVLTAEQICEHAWGNEGSYNHGVSHPVRLLRLAIEPDPEHPTYIETVYRVGYRFTAYKAETCDLC